MKCQLILEKMTLSVRLGCSPQEQALPQTVRAKITLYFPELPKACHNDQLSDAVCYAHLARTVQNFCLNHPFNLLETLGYRLFQLIREDIPANVYFELIIRKKPAVPNVEACSFQISNLPSYQ